MCCLLVVLWWFSSLQCDVTSSICFIWNRLRYVMCLHDVSFYFLFYFLDLFHCAHISPYHHHQQSCLSASLILNRGVYVLGYTLWSLNTWLTWWSLVAFVVVLISVFALIIGTRYVCETGVWLWGVCVCVCDYVIGNRVVGTGFGLMQCWLY